MEGTHVYFSNYLPHSCLEWGDWVISGAAFSFAFRSINKILSVRKEKKQKEGAILASISQKCTPASKTHHTYWNYVPGMLALPIP